MAVPVHLLHLGVLSLAPEGYLLLRSPGEFIFRFPEAWPLVGGGGLRWYGALMGTAVLVGLILAKTLAEQRHLEREPGTASERVEQLALWLVLGGFAGARLYYVASHWSEFQGNPLMAFAIWQGGIIIHGGILAGALVLYFFCRITGINGWKYADILTPSLILGQAIGRWGNFFNAEAYGAPITAESAWPIREFIPPESRVVDPARGLDFSPFDTYHPIFLYESLLNLLLFGVLLVMFQRFPRLKDGTWVWTYLIGYSLIRVPYEVLRISAVAYLGTSSIKVAYLASGLGVILGIGMLVYMYRVRKDPDLGAICTWLVEAAGLEATAAETIVQRSWGVQRRYRRADLEERVSLAMPYFPSSLREDLSLRQRESLMRDLFLQLEGKGPESFPVKLLEA